ncbi:hypothetical protein [Kitasatospora sp. McL0602]|uniref:hypothetical protein n=1 Tax=Kitasatospora sp. McL0602 TaxID=3439530 RepID=UPI003F8C3102
MRSVHQRIAVTATALVLASGGLVAGTANALSAGAQAAAHPAATALLSSCSQAYLPLPDPACTPGTLNPSVTQSTIGSTICVSGWTATVRPSTSYTNKLKAQQIIAYGYSDTNLSDYEEDHFIPLELGGNPTDPANLWPEPHSGTATSSQKDGVETKLKYAVCAHKVTLAAAQNALVTDWTTAVARLGL